MRSLYLYKLGQVRRMHPTRVSLSPPPELRPSDLFNHIREIDSARHLPHRQVCLIDFKEALWAKAGKAGRDYEIIAVCSEIISFKELASPFERITAAESGSWALAQIERYQEGSDLLARGIVIFLTSHFLSKF